MKAKTITGEPVNIGDKIHVISGGEGAFSVNYRTGTVVSLKEIKDSKTGGYNGAHLGKAELYIKSDDLEWYYGLCSGYKVELISPSLKTDLKTIKDFKYSDVEQELRTLLMMRGQVASGCLNGRFGTDSGNQIEKMESYNIRIKKLLKI